ncbi:hypothetical protein I4U23_005566 [Adineta vaga]|nr:hypothetical protein I4U23_005566 [Adineta vaga]
MENIVTSLITQLELDNDQITNIYNYGSWVYGTNHEGSDLYDSNINLSKISNNHRPIQLRYTSTNNRRYRIGCFQCRKVYRSS